MYPVALAVEDLDAHSVVREDLIQELRDDVVKAYDEREQELGTEMMRALERFMLLQIIDERWREHLHDMDYLREGIHLRGFAQIDPLVAYKNEGFEMFTALMNAIWEEFARYIFNVEVEVESGDGRGAQSSRWGASASSSSTGSLEYAGGTAEDQPSALAAARAGGATAAGTPLAAAPGGDAGGYPEAPTGLDASDEPPAVVETRRVGEREKIGRNDPCWCGSGKKYKKCHGA
jgi:preprotein translocase subunit SecA